MQLGDLICSGVHSSILMSATINRNVMNCSKEIIIELIFGADEFLESLRALTISIFSGASERADVGD